MAIGVNLNILRSQCPSTATGWVPTIFLASCSEAADTGAFASLTELGLTRVCLGTMLLLGGVLGIFDIGRILE